MEDDQSTDEYETSDIDSVIANNDLFSNEIDEGLGNLDVAVESITQLLNVAQLINKTPEGSSHITQEAIALNIDTIYNNLGFKQARTKVAIENLNSTKEIALEGVSDAIGLVVKKLIDLVAFLFDGVEKLWNNTVRGLVITRKKVTRAKEIANAMPNTSAVSTGMASKRITKTFQLTSDNILTPKDVKEIIDNHFEVADSVREYKDTMSDLVERDIDRVISVYKKAQQDVKIGKEDMYGNSVMKIRKLVNTMKKNQSILLGEGQSMFLEIDEDALDSYLFQRASLQITMVKHINAFQADDVKMANKREAIDIANSLEKTANRVKGLCDFYLTFAHTYSAKIKNEWLVYLTSLLSALASSVGLAILGIPLAIVGIIAYFKSLMYMIINICKYFATKFSNVTFRTLDVGCMYIKESAGV